MTLSQPDSSGPLPAAYRKFAFLLVAAATALGFLGLLGWILKMPLLASIRSSYIPMAPLTAIIFVCLGGLLLVHSMWPSQGPVGISAAVLSALLSAYGLIELVECLGIPLLSLEEWLFPDLPMIGAIHTGRMSPVTSALVFLSGAVVPILFLLERGGERQKVFRDLAGCLGLVVALTGTVFLMGYLHGTPLLYGTLTIPMAATTALAFLLLGTGQVLAVGPDGFPSRLLAGPSARARLLRVFVSTTVGVVVAVDLMHVYAHWIFFEDNAFMSGVSTTAIAVVTGALIARVAFKVGEDMDRSEEARKRAEEEMQQSEARYRAVAQSATDAIISADSAGNIVHWNQGAETIFGYPEVDVIGQPATLLMPPRFREKHLAGMARMRAGGESHVLGKVVEMEGVRKDGSEFPIEFSLAAWQVADGRYYTAIVRDITKRKQAEEELRSSSDTLQALVNSSPLAIVTFDKDGNIGMWNPAAERMFGWRAEEVMGRPHPIVPEDMQEEFREFRESALGGRMFTGRELRRLRKDGSYIDISVSTAPLRDAAGSITSVMSIIQDITERKCAEQENRNLERQIQQTQKLESLGVLAGGIAHDFNNLLMAVLGHAELALEEISPMSAARGNLTNITTAARRAADLCQQMLAYAGKSSFELERVELRDLVEEMAHLLKTAISKKAILNLNLERGLPPIQADPSQIRQIVMNLIINASEAIGDRSGVITLSVGATRCDEEYLQKTELREDLAPGLYLHLEVTDTGSGMDAQTRSRIFEPFFSTKFTGRGLGLAAVLGIVRAHKGALKVYSEPGKGTTFKILFPALEDAGNEARTEKSSPLADWRGKGTILLVDDEESLIALGARMLEHLGFTVLTAADGLQAVNLYRERGKETDLVLMDLTMPHMDGAKAFGELRRLNPEVRVVLASGYSHEDVASRFAGKGLSGVLQKPYTLLKLREALAGLLPKREDGEG